MTTKTETTWRTVRLGDTAGVLGGFAFPSNLFNKQVSGFPVIKISNLTDGEVDVKNAEYVDIEKVGRDISKFKIDIGDFLVAMTGATAGKVGKLNTKGVFYLNQRVGKFFSKDESALDKTYLYYSVINPRNKNTLKRLADGSAQGNMSSSQIENNLELTIPPTTKEQKHIAEVLSAFDEKIENNNRIIKTLEEMAQAVFKEWFVKFRFPKHEGAEFVDSSLGKIPKGWEVKKLEDAADISIGRTPPREQSQWFVKNGKGKKWISIKDMGSSGIYLFNTAEQLTNEAIKKFNIQSIPANTVVVSFKLTMGRVAITTEEMASNEAIAHLPPKTDTGLFSEYLYLFMQGVRLADFGSTSSIGTAVNSKTIRRVPILQPENEILKKAKDILQPIFEEMKAKTLETQGLANMRDLLLPRLMSGEIRV